MNKILLNHHTHQKLNLNMKIFLGDRRHSTDSRNTSFELSQKNWVFEKKRKIFNLTWKEENAVNDSYHYQGLCLATGAKTTIIGLHKSQEYWHYMCVKFKLQKKRNKYKFCKRQKNFIRFFKHSCTDSKQQGYIITTWWG